MEVSRVEASLKFIDVELSMNRVVGELNSGLMITMCVLTIKMV